MIVVLLVYYCCCCCCLIIFNKHRTYLKCIPCKEFHDFISCLFITIAVLPSLSLCLSLSLSLSLSLQTTLWIAQLQQTLTNYALFPKCWMQQIIILIIMTHLILELITHLMCLGEWFSMLWKMWFKWLISKLQFICYKCKKTCNWIEKIKQAYQWR